MGAHRSSSPSGLPGRYQQGENTMCGIAGFVDHSCGPEEGSERLSLMLKSILHRGPDGEGRMVLPQAGLFAGMRRLAIIDLSSGDQPIWNEDRSIGVLFNGEIYNFKE